MFYLSDLQVVDAPCEAMSPVKTWSDSQLQPLSRLFGPWEVKDLREYVGTCVSSTDQSNINLVPDKLNDEPG